MSIVSVFGMQTASQEQLAVTFDSLDARNNSFICAPFYFPAQIERSKWVTSCGSIAQFEYTRLLITDSVKKYNISLKKLTFTNNKKK